MKPRNFPGRKLRRQINAHLRVEDRGLVGTPSNREIAVMLQPTDTRIRLGAEKRKEWLK
ncbi:MAG: hypothetical protein ACOYBW_08815 [Fluviibacter phosphoraccumulans]